MLNYPTFRELRSANPVDTNVNDQSQKLTHFGLLSLNVWKHKKIIFFDYKKKKFPQSIHINFDLTTQKIRLLLHSYIENASFQFPRMSVPFWENPSIRHNVTHISSRCRWTHVNNQSEWCFYFDTVNFTAKFEVLLSVLLSLVRYPQHSFTSM